MREPTNLEYQVTEYVIKHQPELLKDIESLATDAKDNPILASYWKEARHDEMVQYIANALGLSYEDVSCVVDEGFINSYITKEHDATNSTVIP